jgi:hypothetical protein
MEIAANEERLRQLKLISRNQPSTADGQLLTEDADNYGIKASLKRLLYGSIEKLTTNYHFPPPYILTIS